MSGFRSTLLLEGRRRAPKPGQRRRRTFCRDRLGRGSTPEEEIDRRAEVVSPLVIPNLLGTLVFVYLFLFPTRILGWQKGGDPTLPTFPPDPTLEALFDTKARQVPERLRGTIRKAIRNLDRESPELRRRARTQLTALNRASRSEVERTILGENRIRAVGSLLVLSGMTGADPTPLLRQTLEPTYPEEVRATAALVLGRERSREGYLPLTRMLSEKKHSFARVAAALGLAKTRDIRALDPLISTVQREENEELTGACLLGLGLLGAPRKSKPLLLEHLRSNSSPIRRGAILGLAAADPEEIVKPLLRLLKEGDPDQQTDAAAGLALRSTTPNVEDGLRRAFRRGDPPVRAACLRSLSPLATPVDWSLILEAMSDGASEVRLAAVAIASRAEDPEVDRALIRLLSSPEEPGNVRGTCALSLAVRGSSELARPLRKLLSDESDEEARIDLSLAVAHLDPQAESFLRRTRKPDASVREDRIYDLLAHHPEGHERIQLWIIHRLASRGPSGEAGLVRLMNQYALELLGLDKLPDRPILRRETVVTRSTPIDREDLRIWLVENPYFDRMYR